MAFGRIRTFRFLIVVLALVITSAAAGTMLERTANASLLESVASLTATMSSSASRTASPKTTESRVPAPENAYGSSGDRIIVGQGNGNTFLSGSRVDKLQMLQPSGTPSVLANIDDFEPQWSPDGKKIVFISLRDAPPSTNYFTRHDYRALYTMNSDGTDQTRVFVSGISGLMQPTFSPDGQKIAFLDNGDRLYTIDTIGTNQTEVDTSQCFVPGISKPARNPKRDSSLIPGVYGPHSPDYSPDGNHIIYVQWDSVLEVYAIFRVPTDGSGGCSLVYASNDDVTPISPQYSPDGTKIAVYRVEGSSDPATAVRKLRIIDATTGVTIADHTPSGFFGEPFWSPDGTKIAYPIGTYDEIAGQEIKGLGVRTYELATGVEENVDLTGFYEGINGLHWGVPTTVIPELRMRVNSPHPLISGNATTATLTLSSPAPAGGTTITLGALGAVGAITVPASVLIPEGETSVDFTINSAASTLYRTAGVLATRNSPSIAQAQHSVSLHPSRPDIAATAFTVPVAAAPNVAFTTNRTIQNLGLVSSTAFSDAVYLSTDNVLDAGDGSPIFTASQSALAAGASRGPTAGNVTIPANRIPASGSFFLIYKTNYFETMVESSYANNTIVQPIQVNVADLVVENLVVPANVEPGVGYSVTFNVRNQGNATATGNASTQIFYSEDSVAGNADDVSVISSFNISNLAAGATSPQNRTVTIPTTPQRNDGSAFFYVRVDSGNTIPEGTNVGENNNTTFAPTAFAYRVPDLQVTASSAAADVDTDTAFPLSWTTANAGNKATTANLVDRVYLSTDQTVGGDTTLGSFTLTGGLNAGATADRIQNITIPYASVSASGTYYLLIQTDATSLVNEGANEGNNVRVQPIYIRKALRPDLTVSNVTGPPTVFFDQTIQVQWTVTNGGAGPTNAPQWKDRLYIGTSSTSTSGATLLAEVNSITALNPGESYTTSATVKIPRGINGGYHFLVRANSNGAVNEVSTSNNLLSSPVQVNIPPLPDLIVASVQAPDEVFAGQAVSIQYSISNIGTNEANGRKDRIYLSRDTVLNTAQDKLIFTSDWLYGPQAGQTTSHVSQNRIGTENPPQYAPAHIPSDIEGLWYVFVVADYSNSVYEFNSENNNTGYDTSEPGSPMNILVTPPDLVIQNAPVAPSIAASGTTIQVGFTVKNQGAFNAGANLYHAVYLSTDATFSRTTDTLIGSVKDTAFFPPAGEHPFEISASIPNCLANGDNYLFAVADFDGRQFEFDPGFDAEGNNASPARLIQLSTTPPDLQVTSLTVPPITMPGQSANLNWIVSNTGGSTTRNWTDRIYLHSLNPDIPTQTIGSVERVGGLPGGASYSVTRAVTLPTFMEGTYYITVTADESNSVPECGTSESNNAAQSANFTVQNDLPDLVIDTVTVPAGTTVGDTFQIQWGGRNANGAMPVNSSNWRDNVYLSADANLSNGDIYLGSSLNTAILGPGQTYLQQTNVTIGNVSAGNYYILVVADGGRNIYEGTSGSIYENNNVKASGQITLSAPAVDLQAGGVSVSSPQYSGTYRNFSWTVTNTGTTQTLASGWSDHVYLSRDAILDPTDTQLGYINRSGPLAGGESYTQNTALFIPTGLTGVYNIFVVTDRNNVVVENNNANNTSPPVAINLTVPPPAELSITNITPPATFTVGGVATFSWTVQNTGANPVEGQWRDTVYLSRDQFWDASDILVGVRDLNCQTTSVPAGGGTYTTSFSGQTPPVDEGTYYVVVRTDAQNRIRESNEANNVGTSVSTTAVTIAELQLNSPVNTTLGIGAQMFFKYVTDPAETLVFSLTTDRPQRSNEVLTNFGTMVSRSDYDFQSSRPGEGDQENVIDPTQEGNYYSMVRTDLIPESFAANFHKDPDKPTQQSGTSVQPQNITVEAKILPFSIRKVSPEIIGNAGYATIVVEGAKFLPGATMKLVKSGSPDVSPAEQRTLTNKIVGMFDMTGTAAGKYDVVVTNPGGQVATLVEGCEIVSGGGAAEPRISINGPGSIRGGRARYTISISNDGLNDKYLVPFFIVMPSRYSYELDHSNFITDFAEYLPPDATPGQIPTHYDQNGLRIIPLFTPVLGSKRTVNVNIDIILPFGFSNFEINAFAMPPLEEWYGLARSAQEEFLNRNLANLNSPEKCEGKWNACMAEALRGIFFTLIAELLPGGCVGEGWKAVVGISDYVIGIVVKGDEAGLWDAVGGTANILLGSLGGIAKECFLEEIPWYKAAAASVAIFKLLMDFYACYQQYVDCMAPPPVKKGVSFPFSLDPNEKIGPTGYGGEKFVPVGQPLEYRINFENLSSATAPAQLVRITDSLPPPLDLRTVRLKEIGFKQYRYIVPANQSFYQSRVQLGEDLGNIQADILAGVDLVNNRVFWNIQAIDPNTSEAPIDPNAGILPPNNGNRDGEGYVIFTVEAKSSFANRTMISNSATIVFDQNEPIVTNATENLLDSVVPTSQIAVLPPTSAVPEIQLNWSSTDDTDGSGFAGSSILYSENGGGYLPYLNTASDTVTTFSGKWGKTYRFYSIGRDNAGNVERAPEQPDATIRILGGDTEGDVAPRPNGNDGQVGNDDVAQIRRFIAALDNANIYNEFQRSDAAPRPAGGDGALSVGDVVQARRYAAALDARSEAGGPETPMSYAPKPIAGKRAGLLAREIKPLSLYRAGNKVVVAVDLEAQGDEVAAGFALNFDPAVLSSPTSIELGPDAAGAVLTINDSQAAAGKLGIAIDRAPGSPFAAGSRRLLYVAFDVAPGHPPTTNIGFSSDPVITEVVDGNATTLSTAFTAANVSLLVPTSAGATVDGTVTRANGAALSRATVILSGTSGARRSVLTNGFGRFRFDDVAVGETYTIEVRAKGLVFRPRLITVTEDVNGIEIGPEP